MRERSETIYAENEDNYKEMMNSLDLRRERNRNRRHKKTLNEELIAEELNCFQNYNLSIIEPTIEEKEREDERNLLNAIQNLNRKKFKKNLSNELVFQGLIENIDSDLQIVISNESLQVKSSDSSRNDQILKDSLNLKMSMSKNSLDANTLSYENSQIEAIINQNVINFEQILKLIVIGDKSVGKTLFIDRFICDENVKTNVNKIFVPTECLEIKKAFKKILNTNTKIELWDTNISILNTPIINTYLKISNGFVLIADYDKVDSFIFLEKHLENIHSISNTHNEILFIINKKSAYDTVNFSKEDSLVESKINYLKEYYNISPLYINLWESWRGLYDEKDKFTIQKFLEHILMKKLGEIFKIKENSSNIKLNYSKSPNKIKNPIKISPNTLEISNFLNITKKRTRSVKKNLNHIFEKLKLESI